MPEKELLPCPFCGGKVELFPSLQFYPSYWVIFCPGCCTQTELFDDPDELTDYWNKAVTDLNCRR